VSPERTERGAGLRVAGGAVSPYPSPPPAGPTPAPGHGSPLAERSAFGPPTGLGSLHDQGSRAPDDRVAGRGRVVAFRPQRVRTCVRR
jgi:hypothetical protein